MEKQIDFYFDLVSPYSYVASLLIEGVAERGGAEVNWKPFLLGGVFKAVGTDNAPGLHPAKNHIWIRIYSVFRCIIRFP